MRLNRAGANMRDKDRIQGRGGNVPLQDQACDSIWRELVGESLIFHGFCASNALVSANWKRRTQLVQYCVSVVDQSIMDSRNVMESQSPDAASKRNLQGDIFAVEVKVCLDTFFILFPFLYFSCKRKQVHRELSVEEIVRKRSIDGMSPSKTCYNVYSP